MNSSTKQISADDGLSPAPQPVTGSPTPLGRQARLIVAALAICAIAALFWPRGEKSFREPGGFLIDENGQATKLGPQLAPVTLVHFWATWCPPCRDEIPALQRLAKDLDQEPDFALVMIAVADQTDKAKVFLGDWADMALYDPNWDVANRYGTDKLPETYLVVGGEVVEKFVGQTDWDNPELRAKLKARLRSSGNRTAELRTARP